MWICFVSKIGTDTYEKYTNGRIYFRIFCTKVNEDYPANIPRKELYPEPTTKNFTEDTSPDRSTRNIVEE